MGAGFKPPRCFRLNEMTVPTPAPKTGTPLSADVMKEAERKLVNAAFTFGRPAALTAAQAAG